MTDKLPMPITDEQIDAAYRDVWSTVPHAQRLSAFARKIAAEAVRLEREAILKAIDDIEEKPWYGYENPNTFQDAKWAAEAVVRARSEL